MSIRFWFYLGFSLIFIILSACTQSSHEAEKSPTYQDMIAADAQKQNWFTTGGQFGETRYSPLDQINQDTVGELGFAWSYDLYTRRGIEATPVMVDGIVYGSGTWGQAYAVNAKTGEEIWTFDPEVEGQKAKDACCDIVNRGVAVWDGLVYVAALDGHLFALDSKTGTVLWKVDTFGDTKRRYTSTGAPRVAGSVVVIGNGGADLNARGYVTAYNLKTGKQAWRFYTVPSDPDLPFEHPEMEVASKTWDPDSRWDVGGGGTVWDSMVYDPKLNLLYVGTGNSALYPQSERSPKGGDNLYVCSILAINPDTGRLVWHYQTTPGDSWDYTSTQNMILTDLDWKGQTRQVLMQAPKNGYFYILDRESGELLSAEPFVPVNWSTHVDMETGKPVLTERSNYFSEPKVIWPAAKGGHGWRPMAYSENTGLVYIPTYEDAELQMNMFPDGYEYTEHHQTHGGMLPLPLVTAAVDYFAPIIQYDLDEVKEAIRNSDAPPKGAFLRAWDPVTQTKVWDVEMDSFRNGGGALATAGGLVFQSRASGELNIYNDKTGELLKSVDTGSGLMAGASTYMLDGEQYVVVMGGLGGGGFFTFPKDSAAYKYGNDGRMIAFKLGGKKVPLPEPVTWPAQPKPPTHTGTPESIAKGHELFIWNCFSCHSSSGVGLLPNLNNLTENTHANFDGIVRNGDLSTNGMPKFGDILTQDETDAIHDFLIASAHKAYTATNKTQEQDLGSGH